MNDKKIFYFEGAGNVPAGGLDNCRIRTAFHDDLGRAIYLEMTGNTPVKGGRHQHLTVATYVWHLHLISGKKESLKHKDDVFEYNCYEILRFVNSLGCSFDEIVILPSLAGYRVHAENRGYNFGDKFHFDPELTERREKIRQVYYDLEKSEGK